VFFAYATVTPSEVVLFIEKSRLNEAAQTALEKDQVIIKPYEAIMEHLKANSLCSDSEVNMSIVSLVSWCTDTCNPQKVLIGGKTSLAIVNHLGRVSIHRYY
jgi:Xaa-Pro aminopeptidase